MTLDFNNLVQNLDENDLLSLHQELVSRNLYNNLVDLSDIGDDIDRIRNIVHIPLQRLNYEDIKQIAPEPIKQAISTFIESETKTAEISEPDEEVINTQSFVESREKDIDEIKKRLGIITSERGTNNRILPEYRDEVLGLTTKLNKVYNMSVKDIAQFTNMSMPSVSRNVKNFMDRHPYEEHRWLAAAEKKAIVTADKTLTEAAGKTADKLVETYLSLGQWTIETYTLMSQSLGMSVRELVELGVDSYNPSIHIDMLELQSEKDEYKSESDQLKSYIIYQNTRIHELELLLLEMLKQQNPDAIKIIEMSSQNIET